jgi:hypothetical protein
LPNENPAEDDGVSLKVNDGKGVFAGVAPIPLPLYDFGAGVELPSEKVDGPGVLGGVVTDGKAFLTLCGGVDNPGGAAGTSLTNFARFVYPPS